MISSCAVNHYVGPLVKTLLLLMVILFGQSFEDDILMKSSLVLFVEKLRNFCTCTLNPLDLFLKSKITLKT